MKTANFAIALFFSISFCCTDVRAQSGNPLPNQKIKALIVDGQNNHAIWPKTTKMMKRYLEETGKFEVSVATTKPKGTDSDFKPVFSDYNVVISNFGFGAAPWPEETRKAFVEYIKHGGGLVVVHAADNSFPEWPEFNVMIGLGGWGGRNEKSGPYVYFDAQGKEVRDESAGSGGNHGPQHEFSVVIRDSKHPITKGLPSEFLHAKDELYQQLRGPGVNMKILATSFADPKYKGTNRHEPMIMTIDYGKGRVFHTPLGHADYSCECVGFIAVFQRGTEWAATGKVSIDVPADFPTADKTSIRKFSEIEESIGDQQSKLSAAVDQMIQTIEAGDARKTFESLLPPTQLKSFLDGPNVEQKLEEFKQSGGPELLEILKSLDAKKAEYEGDEAKFKIKNGRSLRFQQIDGKWFLKN